LKLNSDTVSVYNGHYFTPSHLHTFTISTTIIGKYKSGNIIEEIDSRESRE
jgi:hypothetical protein